MEVEGLVPGLLRDRLQWQALSWAKAPWEGHVLRRCGSSLAGRIPPGSVDEALSQVPEEEAPPAAPALPRQPSSPISKTVPELKVFLFMFLPLPKLLVFSSECSLKIFCSAILLKICSAEEKR